VLVAQKYLMISKRTLPVVVGWSSHPSVTIPYNNNVQMVRDLQNRKPERARWFPAALHSIHFGKVNLFEIISGSENDLGPNQKELKRRVDEQSRKIHQPLRIPTFLEVIRHKTKEELAGLIMNHLIVNHFILDSSHKMIFLPALPMEDFFKKPRSNRLSSEELVPVRFPVL